MKVLLVEDQTELASNIKSYLEQEGNICETAAGFTTATEKIYSHGYDVIVLDLMLPDGSGLELLRLIKGRWPERGVLIISAKNALTDKIRGLDLGADDYLSKPFHLAELNARINAIYRRKHQQGENRLIFENIEMNMDVHEVQVNGQPLDLTRKEFELLHYLIVNKNRLLTKQAIAEHLWGDYMEMADSFDFVYQHIKNLRKKIANAGGDDVIHTIYGTGYKLKA